MAKNIWKAIHQEQIIRGEIALFQQWLTLQPTQTSCAFPDLKLTNITPILTRVLFQIKQTSDNDDHKNQDNTHNQ